MSEGPENRMLNRLKPRLERALGLYIEKTANPYHSGMGDWYLEWDGCNGWVEAKHWDIKTDSKTKVPIKGFMKKCSALQKRWLERSASNRIPTAVLCGFPDSSKYAFLALPAPPESEWAETHIPLLSYSELEIQLADWMNSRRQINDVEKESL